jgi:NAD(P)-dependent dehydrogenase (short-subunit alcohol dehydrogenase family)
MADGKVLAGKSAFVTGSSRGMGRVIATHLAHLGATVALQGTTPTSARAFGEADSLEAVARAIAAGSGSRVIPVHGNLADPAVVRTLVGAVRGACGQIDILVNCAGATSAWPGPARPWGAGPRRTMPSGSLTKISGRCSTATS